MPHTYKFADAEQTTVVRDDGATFPWQKGTEPGAVGAALGGFVGEDYRTDGSPMPDAFGAKDKGPAKPQRALKLGPKKRRKGKFAQPVDADKHPRPKGTPVGPVDDDNHPERKPPRRPRKQPKVKKGRKHK